MKKLKKLSIFWLTLCIGTISVDAASQTSETSSEDTISDRAKRRERVEGKDVNVDIHTPESPHRSAQVYGIATYDALFKYVLSQKSIQASFFHTFLPNMPVKNIQRLDEHMNPVKSFQTLRDTFTGADVKKTVAALKKAKEIFVQTKKKSQDDLESNDDATTFLTNVVNHFDDFQRLIPRQEYDGTMDFVCELDSGEFALVEMQVVPKDYWDGRALAYVASFYGNQLRQGDGWHDLKKVVSINILGGGKDALRHWGETPDQFIRHYKVQEQNHQPSRFIDGIEIIQYSLMNAPKTFDERELKDWIMFFKNGSKMTEDEVKSKVKTQAVLEAFNFSKISSLPEKVKEDYQDQENRFNQYSQHTNEKIAEGKAEGELIGQIKALIEHTNLNDDEIFEKLKSKYKDITLDQIRKIRNPV